MIDQAEELRRLAGAEVGQDAATVPPLAQRTRVLAVTSGKGGVGKTNVSVNLSYALMELGHSVLILDADLGLANVDVLLGTTPPLHLGHLLNGERTFEDLIYTGPRGLQLIAGGSGLGELTAATPPALQRFVGSLRRLNGRVDYMIVDTGAGIGPAVLALLLAADEILLVTTPEPTAITDAYAVVKTIVRRQPGARISLIVNQAQSRAEAAQVAERLTRAVVGFLGFPIDFLGHLPHDPAVARSVRAQSPFFLEHPISPAAAALRDLARQLAGADQGRPQVRLFFHRLSRVLSGGLFLRP